jgi:hypothetical protein
MPCARPSRLPAMLRTSILFSMIHSTTWLDRVIPSSTRRQVLLNWWHASIVARASGVLTAPNQSVASESRALAKVQARWEED